MGQVDRPLQYLSPTSLIRAAQESHPAFKYATAVAGLASLVVVVLRFGSSPAAVLLGILALLILMVLFLLFSQAIAVGGATLSTPVRAFVWSCLALGVLTASLLFTSAFFDSPLPAKSMLVQQLLGELAVEPEMVGAVFSGTVDTHEGGMNVEHRASLTLSVSRGIATGEYTNDAGDAGVVTGTLSGNSLELKLISRTVTGECQLNGRLNPERTSLSGIYNCSDDEHAKVDLTRQMLAR
jgi:hypothetical protein